MSLFSQISAALKADAPAAPSPASAPSVAPAPASAPAPAAKQEDTARAGAADPNNPANKSAETIWKQEIPAAPSSQAVFQPDLAKFSESVKGMDFLKSISPEVQAKIAAGDASAMQTAIQEASRAAFAQAMMGTQQMVETALAKRTQEIEKTMMEQYRQSAAGMAATGSNPAFRDPEVSPIFSDVQKRFAARFPEAAPAELAQHTETMLINMAKKILENSPEGRKSKETADARTNNQSTDWMAWGTDGSPTSLFPS